jgi:hypothetical protein
VHARLFLLLLPLLFIACSSVERNPSCIQSSDASEIKCDHEKTPKTGAIRGGYRERL